jgi:hypothetical protein
MALTTYAELKTTVTDLTSVIPTFIDIAQAKIYREMRLSSLEANTTVNTVSGQDYIDIPTRSNGIAAIKLNTSPVTSLRYEPPETINMKYAGSTSGQPIMYSISENKIILAPTPASVYEVDITYYQRPESLSDSVSTNWFMANAPELLLYGSLLEASPYLKDDARIAVWSAGYEQVKRELTKQDKAIKYPQGSTLQIRAN